MEEQLEMAKEVGGTAMNNEIMPLNELLAFKFQEKGELRAVYRDGEPWVVAKDVCDILGLENVTAALRNFPEDERNTLIISKGISPERGNPNVNIINEPGIYRLIFQSRKPEAEKFKRWVFHEVLPSIRKEGYYAVPQLAERLNERLEKLEAAVAALPPPAEDPQAKQYAEIRKFLVENLNITGIRRNFVYSEDLWRRFRDVFPGTRLNMKALLFAAANIKLNGISVVSQGAYRGLRGCTLMSDDLY